MPKFSELLCEELVQCSADAAVLADVQTASEMRTRVKESAGGGAGGGGGKRLSLGGTGARKVCTDSVLDGSQGDLEVVGLFFSAEWCSPSRSFVPRLARAYAAINGIKARVNEESEDKINDDDEEQQQQGQPAEQPPKRFEIVYVSADEDAAQFRKYTQTMPWLAIPLTEHRALRTQKFRYGVDGIPVLVLLDRNGDLLTTEGRNKILDDPEGKGFPWVARAQPPPLSSIAQRSHRQLKRARSVLNIPRRNNPTVYTILGAKRATASSSALWIDVAVKLIKSKDPGLFELRRIRYALSVVMDKRRRLLYDNVGEAAFLVQEASTDPSVLLYAFYPRNVKVLDGKLAGGVLILMLLVFLVMPILAGLKGDGGTLESVPWAAVWTPLWIATAALIASSVRIWHLLGDEDVPADAWHQYNMTDGVLATTVAAPSSIEGAPDVTVSAAPGASSAFVDMIGTGAGTSSAGMNQPEPQNYLQLAALTISKLDRYLNTPRVIKQRAIANAFLLLVFQILLVGKLDDDALGDYPWGVALLPWMIWEILIVTVNLGPSLRHLPDLDVSPMDLLDQRRFLASILQQLHETHEREYARRAGMAAVCRLVFSIVLAVKLDADPSYSFVEAMLPLLLCVFIGTFVTCCLSCMRHSGRHITDEYNVPGTESSDDDIGLHILDVIDRTFETTNRGMLWFMGSLTLVLLMINVGGTSWSAVNAFIPFFLFLVYLCMPFTCAAAVRAYADIEGGNDSTEPVHPNDVEVQLANVFPSTDNGGGKEVDEIDMHFNAMFHALAKTRQSITSPGRAGEGDLTASGAGDQSKNPAAQLEPELRRLELQLRRARETAQCGRAAVRRAFSSRRNVEQAREKSMRDLQRTASTAAETLADTGDDGDGDSDGGGSNDSGSTQDDAYLEPIDEDAEDGRNDGDDDEEEERAVNGSKTVSDNASHHHHRQRQHHRQHRHRPQEDDTGDSSGESSEEEPEHHTVLRGTGVHETDHTLPVITVFITCSQRDFFAEEVKVPLGKVFGASGGLDDWSDRGEFRHHPSVHVASREFQMKHSRSVLVTALSSIEDTDEDEERAEAIGLPSRARLNLHFVERPADISRIDEVPDAVVLCTTNRRNTSTEDEKRTMLAIARERAPLAPGFIVIWDQEEGRSPVKVRENKAMAFDVGLGYTEIRTGQQRRPSIRKLFGKIARMILIQQKQQQQP